MMQIGHARRVVILSNGCICCIAEIGVLTIAEIDRIMGECVDAGRLAASEAFLIQTIF